MARIKSKNTEPELKVRRAAHALGYRFRLHRRDLPGKPDLVFARRRKVIFVHGCFWHQHTDPACLDGRKPRSNSTYWDTKLARNLDRDRNANLELQRLGWDVLTIWECELKDERALSKRLIEFLGSRRFSIS
jgi:DNA mismatch endonuclease (patch repair protein)